MRSLLSIESINEPPSRSIEFVLDFTKDELDLDIVMYLPIGIGVDGKRGEWGLNLNKPIYGLKKTSANWVDFIKLV